MKVFEYALYRYAVRLMSPEEHGEAKLLARRADEGDREADAMLREFVLHIVQRRPANE